MDQNRPNSDTTNANKGWDELSAALDKVLKRIDGLPSRTTSLDLEFLLSAAFKAGELQSTTYTYFCKSHESQIVRIKNKLDR